MTRIVAAVLCAAASVASAAPFGSSGIDDWATPPPPSSERGFVPPTAKRIALGNGITVVVVENHQLPIVAMSIVVVGAGSASDPMDKPGVAAFAADLLDEGAGGLSAMQIAEAQDQLGAQISIATGPDAAQLSVTALAKTLAPTIDLLGKIVMKPAFNAKDFERVKGDRATSLELRRDRPREVARNVLLAALYGAESAYGHPGAGWRESFVTIDLGDVQEFYRQRWNPAGTTIVVVGDVNLEAVRRMLEAELGSWQGPRIEVPKPAIDPSPHSLAPRQGLPRVAGSAVTLGNPRRPLEVPGEGRGTHPGDPWKSLPRDGAGAIAPTPPAQRLRLVDRPGSAQSDVRIGTIGIDRHDPQFFAFEVLATALGGGFSSRLTQRLREQLGITYNARAGQTYLRSRGPFEIATSIVTPATGRGIAETLRIVRDLASKPIPEAELEKVKLNLIRALPESFESNSATAQMFADLALLQLPMDFYAHYAAGIRAVTAKEVLSVAQRAISHTAMMVSVVGDAAKIRTQLGQLRLGNPVMYDPHGVVQLRATRGARTRRSGPRHNE